MQEEAGHDCRRDGRGAWLAGPARRRCRRTTRLRPNSTRTSRSRFKGTVTKMEWVNPHVWIHIDVKKPDGTVENWAFEAGHAERALPARLHEGSR